MKYATICSGIEAPSVAWPAWEPVFFSEIEPFPCAVLQTHYPNVPNRGDMKNYKEWPDNAVELICAGTPCQAFSIAGLRKGLDDPRGNLTLVFLGILRRYCPKWVVWENVPGVLSDKTGAFGAFLGGLGQLGYGFAYRVLDAQYFGVPQRRRRVFVVGHFGDWRPAAAVLFERYSLQGHTPPSRQTGQGFAAGLAPSLTRSGRRVEGAGENQGQDPVIAIQEIGKRTGRSTNDTTIGAGISDPGSPMYTLQSNAIHGVAHALRGEGFDASEDGTGRGTPLVLDIAWCLQERDSKGPDSDTKPGHLIPVSFHGSQDPDVSGEITHPLGRNQGQECCVAIAENQRGEVCEMATTNSLSSGGGKAGQGYQAAMLRRKDSLRVRRLTPRECERLQGFPDDYTLVRFRGKPAADGPRYKALGNSMAVPVVSWIGARIEIVDSILTSANIRALRKQQ